MIDTDGFLIWVRTLFEEVGGKDWTRQLLLGGVTAAAFLIFVVIVVALNMHFSKK